MKAIYFLIMLCNLFGIFNSKCFGQNLNQKRTLELFEEGYKKNDYNLLKETLSNDFKIDEYFIDQAENIIPQIISAFPNLDSITTKQINHSTFSSNWFFKNKIEKNIKFTFDSNDKILSIDFFDRIVKNSSEEAENTYTSIDSFTTNFELIGNLIYIKVLLNNHEEYFILDSGAPVTILNSRYFKNKEKSNIEGYGVSGQINFEKIKIDLFNWNGIETKNNTFVSMDLAHLETSKTFKGLIGYDILKEYELLIDYKNSTITLFAKNKTKWHTKIKPQNEINFVYQNNQHIPVVKVNIENKEYNLGLDTGAATNLIDLKIFKKFSTKTFKYLKEGKLIGGDKFEKKEIPYIKIKSTLINNRKFKNMEYAASDISHLNNGYGLAIDGLLGYPFLSKKLVSIDFKEQKVYLWK